MPHFKLSDSRHPQNRCRLLYMGLEGAGQVGQDLTLDQLRTMVKLIMGVQNTRAVKDYQQDMVDFGMLRHNKGEGYEVLPDGLTLLG